MFRKPSQESKAVPIVASFHLEKTPDNVLVRRAIQEAAAGVASLQIGHVNPASTNQGTPGSIGSQGRGDPPNFNIYARPFVPQAYLDINQDSGAAFLPTAPQKVIDFTAYVEQSLGTAVRCLAENPGVLLSRTPPPGGIESLGPQNYVNYFHHHLSHEADAQFRETETSYLYGHDITLLSDPSAPHAGEALCSLQVPGLRENTPFVEEEDIIELRQLAYRNLDGRDEAASNQLHGWTHIIYHARVASVIRATETIVLRVQGLYQSGKFNVKFLVQEERHLPMLLAVQNTHDAISAGSWLSSMLFPHSHDCEIQEQLHPGVFTQQFFDPDLNWEQKKAVESIWSRSYGTLPYLISGPPGTGKTKTIIETALQLTKRTADCQHILLCAPSDPAADTLCQRLIKHLGPDEMLRLTRPYRTFAEVPATILPYCCVDDNKFALPSFRALMEYRVVVTTCRDAGLLTRARMTNRDLFAAEQYLKGMIHSIHPFSTEPSMTRLHWSAILIDEAAQAMEPEALIALEIVTPPRDMYEGAVPLTVMAGDEYQLGPKTSVPSSRLQESLFARLSKRPVYADHPLARGKKGEPPAPLTRSLLPVLRPAFTNLIRNYRSHPAILAVPSRLFYWDTLEPEGMDTGRLAGWNAWRGRGWPVLFHDNVSPDELELPGLIQGHGGWYNRGEADIACSYAQSLVASGRLGPQDVCIMSPFRAQVRHLRQCMRGARYGGLWGVNIGPTEAFQGLESGVVILCVTRANKNFVQQDQKLGWGVIGTPNKMNVALTRAKFGLIVVGSRELMVEDPNWKAFVDFCDRNGLVAETPNKRSEGEKQRGNGTKKGSPLGTTRLEGILIDKERRSREPAGHAWGRLHGVEQGQEMWDGGMVSSCDAEEVGADMDEEHWDGGYDMSFKR